MEFCSATLDIYIGEKEWEEIFDDVIYDIIREWKFEIDEEFDEGCLDLNRNLMGLAKFAFRDLIKEGTITIDVNKEHQLSKWEDIAYDDIKDAFDSWIDKRLYRRSRPSEYTDEQWKTEYLEERESLMDGGCTIINIDKDHFWYIGDDSTPIKEL